MSKRSAFAGALLACALVALGPTAALAAGPYRIADVDDDAVAVQDLGSKVEVATDVVQVWETQLYGQTQSGLQAAAFDERRTLSEFDCAHRAVRTKDVVSYRGGQVVASEGDAGWSAWRTIAPNGRGELSLLTACCPHPEVAQLYASMTELKMLAWGRTQGPLS